MTAEGRNELARLHVNMILHHAAADEVSTNRLREAWITTKYRMGSSAVETWPAWAQYIHFRYQHLTYKTKAHNP
jgi:hypothetical protein